MEVLKALDSILEGCEVTFKESGGVLIFLGRFGANYSVWVELGERDREENSFHSNFYGPRVTFSDLNDAKVYWRYLMDKVSDEAELNEEESLASTVN